MREALVIAEKVRALTKERLQVVDGHAVGATVSIGLTMWRGGEELFETVVSRADEALYVAKDNGRNRVVELA